MFQLAPALLAIGGCQERQQLIDYAFEDHGQQTQAESHGPGMEQSSTLLVWKPYNDSATAKAICGAAEPETGAAASTVPDKLLVQTSLPFGADSSCRMRAANSSPYLELQVVFCVYELVSITPDEGTRCHMGSRPHAL